MFLFRLEVRVDLDRLDLVRLLLHVLQPLHNLRVELLEEVVLKSLVIFDQAFLEELLLRQLSTPLMNDWRLLLVVVLDGDFHLLLLSTSRFVQERWGSSDADAFLEE